MSLVYPERCYYCGKPTTEDKLVCFECIDKIPVISGETCERCGREYQYCTCKIGDFAFDRNVSVYLYDGAVKHLMKRLKFYKRPQTALHLGKELGGFVKRVYASVTFDYVTYVPMYHFGEIQRGYNQSELMAQSVSECINVPIRELLFKRVGMHSQKSLKAAERRHNVRDRFYTKCDLSNKTVLIVDDIMTTGSTLSECAFALKQAGAKAVYTATYANTCKK